MKKSLFRILPAAAIALTTIVGGAAQGAESEVSMETYRLSDGANCFLVPLRADAVESTSEFVDVAALVDFSASQLDSDVRAKAQAAVAAMVANLPENARVQLFAVSNEVEALTDGYVAVDSKELGDAIASLKTRAPLGATDLEKAFTVAADSFDFNENADRSIVFVGRGVSAGAAFNEEVFGETVEKLVDARVPVNAFGVGTTVNEDVLGALANRTGGYVVEQSATAEEAGERLAGAATATVYWPEENALTIAGAEVYPSPLPPIRSDRETYVVGKTTEALDENVEISIPATVADGREAEIAWSVAPSASEASNQYLYRLVEDAAADSGATLSIAGSEMLAARQVALNAATDEALELVEQAVEDGNAEDAQRLADFVEVSLPVEDAKAMNSDVDELFARAEQTIKNENQANLLEASDANVRVMTQQMKTQAQVAMSEARKLARNNPDAALQSVKLQIAYVKRADVLSAADRALILHDLSACAEQIAFEKEQKAVRDYAAMQNQAIVDSAIKAQKAYQKNQLKVEEIMKRFDSLIKESKYVLAAEAADEAAEIAGKNAALPTQAANVARLADAWEQNQALRMKRRTNLLNALMSVERAHIPVSDEPPITYPEPETWIALTKVRKEKYSATNLQGSEAEQRIGQALKVKVDVDGGEDSDLTLSAWIEDVKRQLREEGKDINVVFDNLKIEESDAGGPPSSIMIQENLSGVSLRNALKIVLRPYALDFCILNDALFITTQDEIKTNPEISTSLRLYSVADLIMQPNQGGQMGGMGMMGGMGGMGMMGGMGGMMGGMGGGMMGGMGGGMMGGMGGMMGGMMNVPALGAPKADEAENADGPNDAILRNFLEGDAQEAPEAGLFAVPAKAAKKSEARGTLAQAPVDLNAKWDAYFATKAPKAGSADYDKAREAFEFETMEQVVALTKSQPASAVALIKSALRNDYASPWMYEALAAALIRAKAPQAEIETAILSVADFSGDPIVLMGLAAYLEKVGSQERALKIYRDVARVAPTRPEPYVRGLALAKELNDEEALKWVALGIASIVWDGKLVESVEQEGQEIALDLIEKMKSEGREAEAASFEAQLQAASLRDVIVELQWAGDAELDLAVQEPTGAVCWFAQKRTAAGGVLSEVSTDLSKSFEANREGLRSRVYTCPAGFSGDYNFLISRSWGTVAQNKVTVKIRTNVGTENERSAVEIIELKDDQDVGFTVQLDQGRRQEEVKEEILTAAAALNQLQARSARELSQRVAALQDAKARAAAIGSNVAQDQANKYVSGYKAEDAVENENLDAPQISYVEPDPGHMPIISYISLGAGFSTSAGVSGDRRYVLVAPQPMFSQLLRMFTYNSSSGSSGSSYGGGNGGYGNNNNGGGYGGGYGNNNNGGGYGNNNRGGGYGNNNNNNW